MTEQLNPLKRKSYTEQVARSISWGHYFIFLNILLACAESSAFVYAAPAVSDFMAFAYLLVSWLGHTCFLAVVCYLVIFFPLAFIGNFRYYRVISVVTAVALHTLLLFDIKLYLAIKVHLGITALNLIVGGLDFDTGLNYNFLMIAVPLVLAFELLFAKITTHSLYKAHHPVFVRSVSIVFVACFICSHLMYIWADAYKYEPVTVLRTTLPAHYPMTAKSFLNAHGWLSEDRIRDGVSGDGTLKYPLESISATPDRSPASVLLISFNSLSNTDLSTDTTPFLLKLKSEAQSFENHYLLYENAKDNLFSIFYSLPLQYRSEIFSRGLPPAMTGEMFRQDYLTRTVIADNDKDEARREQCNAMIAAHTGFRPVQLVSASGAHEALALAENIIGGDGSVHRPFFLSLLINDTLEVREAAENYLDLSDPDKDSARPDFSQMLEDFAAERDPFMKYAAQYRFVLRNVDFELQSFFEKLRKKGLLQNTVIILTSHAGNAAYAESNTSFDRRMQHVPLLVIRPDGRLKGTSVNSLSSHLDLVPSVGQEVLKINTPSQMYANGSPLLYLPDRNFLIADDADQLMLIGKDSVTIYSQNGDSYVESDGRKLQIRPNLEDLIRSTREINRFIK